MKITLSRWQSGLPWAPPPSPAAVRPASAGQGKRIPVPPKVSWSFTTGHLPGAFPPPICARDARNACPPGSSCPGPAAPCRWPHRTEQPPPAPTVLPPLLHCWAVSVQGTGVTLAQGSRLRPGQQAVLSHGCTPAAGKEFTPTRRPRPLAGPAEAEASSSALQRLRGSE